MPKCILTEQGGKGGEGGTLSLLGIAITTPPTKTSYLAEDQFDTTGMVVTASYGLSNVEVATAPVIGYSVTPNPLTDGTTEVIVTYSEMGSTATASQAVTVTHRLKKIEVTSTPTQTEYEYGDTLNTAGLVVTATYSDGATAAISPTCAPTSLTTVTDSQAITVSYSENGVTEKANFNVVVNRKSVAKPTWKGTLTYNGNVQSANNTGLWNNYNTTYMTMTGTMSATNASNYNATFTPNSNYRWADGSTSVIEVTWNIAKKNSTTSLSTTVVAINNDNYSGGATVTITSDFDGSFSVSPTSVNNGQLTISINGKTITVKGDGTNAVAATTITVSASGGTNYTVPSNMTFTVSSEYFTWGSETATADATWWANLKKWVATASETDLKNCIGKTKSVTLTSAVLGTTTHLVRCIGYNCDRDKNNPDTSTLTFQTANMLATTTYFNGGNSDMRWSTSQIRTTYCAAYYNAFPGKNSIVTTSQGTCTTTNSSQAGTPTYFDETVFLPSDCQMGFPKGCNYSNGKGYAASYDEYDQYNTNKTSYQYYTSTASRIKKQGDSGSAMHYWERSLNYYYTSSACVVSSDGLPNNYYYNYVFGCAPAFVI